ncbi:MAG TPA: tRNA lysidine(34) synthetase TilS [Chitinophagales bacterium]|nr:tRNA lysidine(34) synthetase TilS [Chitinophagales bacterium]
MSVMIDQFTDFIEANDLFKPADPVLLAISGGADSTVLGHLFRKAGFRFGIGHLNFQLRGTDSDADESFVKALALQWDVPFFVTRADTTAISIARKISIQMAARELRYDWLEEVRKKHGFHFIATAHHRDDAMETVLLNMFRGTGIHGIHGIRPKHGKIVRPLLPFYKRELEAFAQENAITFRQDLSNFETDYDRNKVRIEIIPTIEKFFTSFQDSFSENINRWRDAGLLYEAQINLLKKKLLVHKAQEVFISIPKLQQFPAAKTVLYELLKDFNFTAEQAAFIHASFDSIPGKMFYSATHRLLKDRNQLIISEKANADLSEVLVTENDRSIQLSSVRLKLSLYESSDFPVPQDNVISCLDHRLLEFPLLIRKWKKGDYFYPLGMKKKKKISDYLIDRKMPLHEKEKVWVLQSGERIACIIGERIDERFKIDANTKKVFVITLVK